MSLRSTSRFWNAMALAALIATASFTLTALFAIDPLPPYFIVNDLDGANDEPGQKDLNRMGRFDDPSGYLDIFWNWDEGSTGGNTLDACALFDGDGDANIDFAICGQVGADDKLVAGSPKAYSCIDSDVFHCKSPVELSPLAGDLFAGTLASLDPAGSLITDTDPFGPRNSSEFPYDVTLRIKVKKSFLSNAVLTNVCTYPSHTIDSSDYSDCVSNIGGGFLRIVKNTVGLDGSFTFKVNPVADGQLGDACSQADPQTCRSYTITTVDGAGEVMIGAEINATESVTEIVPAGWQLQSASCQVEGEQTTTGTYDADSHTISGIAIDSGKFTTCTFTNAEQPAKLTVTKVLPNNNGSTAVVSDFTLKVGNTVVTSGQQTDFPAGNYVISETGPSGYVATIGGNCAADGSIQMAPGGTYSCTITNDDDEPSLTLSKIVVNDDGGNASGTSWTLTAACTTPATCDSDVLSGPGGATSNSSFRAGTYSLAESTGPSGYTAGEWSCTGGAQNGSTITLNLGQSATCTITNDDQQGTLTVKKVVINDNGGTQKATDFSFQVNGGSAVAFLQDGDALHGKNTLSRDAGVYSVTEPAVAGYTTTYDGCSNIALANGGTATCTITNNDDQAGLTLIKNVINDNGGTAAASDWTLTANGGAAGVLSGAGGAVSDASFNAGTYTLSESGGPAGYTASAWVCTGAGVQVNNQITLGLGQGATCTITNDDNLTSLTLVKTVVNNNGGSASASDWTLTANGGAAGTLSGAGGAVSGDTFKAGTYTLSESGGPSGYTAAAWACSGTGAQNGNQITLALGQSATCSITNDDDKPSLTLVKTVVNDNGGEAQATDWTLSAGGPSPISGAGGAVSGATFKTGTYTLSESAGPFGYTPSVWTCTGTGDQNGNQITLALGQSATCSIINDDIGPGLTLQKVVVNNNGGTATAADWTLTGKLDGVTKLSGPGPYVSASGSGFEAGTYTLSESGGPDGYDASPWSCSVNGGASFVAGNTIDLGVGANATCTITNDDAAPRLRLQKNVLNNNGGTATAGDWTLTADGGAAGILSGAGGAVSGSTFQAGTYSLSESVGPLGYSASSWSCSKNGGGAVIGDSIALTNGDDVTCTITNDDIPPSLTLIKLVDNSTTNDGLKDASDFLLSAIGTSVSISGAGGVSSGSNFQAGTYTLAEANTTGYVASGWSCNGGVQAGSSISLSLGQAATCTILNTAVNTPPVVEVDKSVAPRNLDSGGGWVTFTVTVRNLSGANDPYTITSLTDDVYGDLTDSGDSKVQDENTCGAAVGTVILPGGSYTCTWKSYFPPLATNQTLTERDIVTVVGIDEDNAGPSSIGTDTDDATVTQSLPIVITHGECVIDTYRRIFSQDSAYHFTATNNGQFFYNVSISGTPGETRHVTLELPWPFVTQGSRPVQVYSAVDFADNCFSNMVGAYSFDNIVYLKDYGVNYPTVKTGYSPSLKTTRIELEVVIPDSGFAFIRQHMDDGLKGPSVDINGDLVLDYLSYGKDNAQNATDPATGLVLMPEHFVHPFGMWGFKCSAADPECDITNHDPLTNTDIAISGGTTLTNDNDFQKNVGVGGVVLYNDLPVAGMTVQLFRGTAFVGSAITDENGGYSIAHKHTGKADEYTVLIFDPFAGITIFAGPGATISGMTVGQPPSTISSATIKANGLVIVNFPLVP
jgi:hypothetical protein